MSKRIGIGLASRIGCPDAYMLSRCIARLARLFAELRPAEYCCEIELFTVLIDVDGMGINWGTPGLRRVRFDKKPKMLSCEFGILEDEWRNLSLDAIRCLLAKNLHASFVLMVKRVRKEGWKFDEKLFMSHVNTVLEIFLNDGGEYIPDSSELEIQERIELIKECKRLAKLLGESFYTIAPGSDEFSQVKL